MAQASSLKELIQIRQDPQIQNFLRSLRHCLGTAVGYKYNEKEQAFDLDKDGKRIPAILVFVEEKIPLASLPQNQRIPDSFKITTCGGTTLECASDVMVGVASNRAVEPPPLGPANERIRRELHEQDIGIVGGLPIETESAEGTAGCVVAFGDDEKLGLLTNFHVAGFPGTRVLDGGFRFRVLGETVKSSFYAPSSTTHRIDVSLVELDTHAISDAKPGVWAVQPLGTTYQLNLDSMEPIGTWVVGVGQTLARQAGRIMGYSYEWRTSVDSDTWTSTDYLILSATHVPFAAPGDSGKLVVTNDDRRQPIALLWGGERHDFWNTPAQGTCAYATDIGTALDAVGAKIFTSTTSQSSPQQTAPVSAS